MNIAVYCSSSDSVRPEFVSLARSLGERIALGGHTLVYGGATGGLMSATADAVAENGGSIIGVVPRAIVDRGRKPDLPMRLFEVGTMEERKSMMKKFADVFVVLPGGYGTLDELFDTVASGMVGEHGKKTVILNPGGFWTPLLDFLAQLDREGLVKNGAGGLCVADTLDDLCAAIGGGNAG